MCRSKSIQSWSLLFTLLAACSPPTVGTDAAVRADAVERTDAVAPIDAIDMADALPSSDPPGLDAVVTDTVADANDDGFDAATDDGADDGPDAAPDVADGAPLTDAFADDAEIDFGPAPSAPSALAARTLAELAVYRNGGTFDDDGDGTNDTTVTVAADGTITTVVTNAHGERLRTVWHSVDDYTVTGDQNGDGAIDERITSSVASSVVRRVWERDRDHDGVFDWRNTVQTDLSMPQPHPRTSTVEERLVPAGGGTRQYVTTNIDDATMSSTACAPAMPVQNGGAPGMPPRCWYSDIPFDRFSSFATYVTPNSLTLPSSGDSIHYMTGGSMHCTSRQIAIIAQAVDYALGEGLDRIGSINTTYHGEILRSLASSQLVIGCGGYPSCVPASVVGFTTEPGTHAFDDVPSGIISLSPGLLNYGPQAVAEIVLHEWLHYAGHGHTPDALSGAGGRDFIYSCGRFGNQWRGYPRFRSENTEPSSARDAAMCADDSHKQLFGTQVVLLESDVIATETAPGAQQSYPPICTTDRMVAPTGGCTCAEINTYTYCDQSLIPPAQRMSGMLNALFCCETCPAATPVNDQSCPLPAQTMWAHPAGASPGNPYVTGCPNVPGAPY